MRGDIHAGQQKPATPDACKVFVNEKELDLIKQKTALFGTENMSAYLRKMAIGGSIINLDMPERDAENGSWVAGTPAACFSQESKDAVERLLYDRDTNPLTEEVFSQFWEAAPLVTLRCTDHAYDQFQELPGAFSRKALFFSATLMNWISAHDGVAG